MITAALVLLIGAFTLGISKFLLENAVNLIVWAIIILMCIIAYGINIRPNIISKAAVTIAHVVSDIVQDPPVR